jgi:hypothetical protein
MKCCYSFLALDDNQVLHILQLKLDSASKLRSLLSMQVVCALCSHSLLTVNSVFPVYGYFLLFSCSCLSIHPRSWRPPPPPPPFSLSSLTHAQIWCRFGTDNRESLPEILLVMGCGCRTPQQSASSPAKSDSRRELLLQLTAWCA